MHRRLAMSQVPAPDASWRGRQESHHQDLVEIALALLQGMWLPPIGAEALALIEPAGRLIVADDHEVDLLDLIRGMGQETAEQGAADAPALGGRRTHIHAPE